MLLVEARRNNPALHNVKNIDLFNLLEILPDKKLPLKENRDKAIAYAIGRHVDKSVIMTVAGAANCRFDYDELDRKGGIFCCYNILFYREEHM